MPREAMPAMPHGVPRDSLDWRCRSMTGAVTAVRRSESCWRRRPTPWGPA